MKNLWNREVKKLILILLIVFVIFFVLCNLLQLGLYKMMCKENNQSFMTFMGNVKELYPDIEEERWIQLLNEQENDEKGREILGYYGIFEDNGTFAAQEKRWKQGIVLINLSMLVFCVVIFTCVFCYLRRRQRKVNQLSVYMKKLEQGEYALEIKDNAEDELSALKNELYKLTVILKEQADNALKQKLALADSVSDISHQLKTPITSVMVLVDNLSESNNMKEDTRRLFLQEITRQLTGVTWLVTTLLKLSKLDAGVVELESKEIAVRALLEEVIGNLEIMADLKQISVRLDIQAECKITGDYHWLKEAFSNIVKNAIEHSPKNTQVDISVQDNAVYTLISVKDYGEGIPKEEQKHIFERFYQRKAGAEKCEGRYAQEESAGIGLALAKEIIERQRGYITVESGEQKGTVFLIKFIK